MAFIKYLLILLSVVFTHAIYALQPDVLLAKVYDESKHGNIENYLVSEKFDGVRAIWTGDKFVTRKGNAINAPSWFTEALPQVWLDGELWIKRNNFARVSGIVRTKIPNNHDWQSVAYQVFDMPDPSIPFSTRYQNYSQLVEKLNLPHIKAVKQHSFNSLQSLTSYFKGLTTQGAEGVMLHLASAKYKSGRSDALLKLKPYLDAEAVVIEHLPGKGKYQGMLGAIKVKTSDGQEFKIGTGFSDVQRKSPPLIGSTVTYRYHGLTKNGLPRFASFLRVREPL
ncbi:DNA ligase 1 [Pseudoalteromonas carrageenovora]|uniref:ATP-dependent DNA ligase n=1 Tax=Pseudoalteromonas carrageenovora IAM 12662 TaxID=1314868 RepID=A0A2K4X7F0_PSEVC|nr:DNA ligase [Pseudoalteromonas carrageenovora]MBE0382468.1 DNA ligase (ATP) [Pseudoalteromonas carrageenovora IAM 12662]QBJ71179.1 DNA ligase 1 [Pseudoalteromonas carrageenovora]GEB69525.1 ATP-dependent DNA ligase [Pseudoalteromonas carrageenovora]SOU40255.1 ATP-dependent DNA ligase [Pseudoalteromonas carrageenovora IAM 12662]